MFEKLIKEMEKLSRTKIEFSVPILPDEEGYLNKECPAKECMFQFKVLAQDWSDKFKDEAVYCPICGHNSPSDSWWTTEQIENAKEQAIKQMKYEVGRALERGVRGSRPVNTGFIKMSLKVKGTTFKPTTIPISCKDIFEKKLYCIKCESSYAVVGNAFFCPCCGDNTVSSAFFDSLKNTEMKINKASEIASFFTKEGLNDQAVDFKRDLIESAVCDSVASFQYFCEKMQSDKFKDIPVRRNLFQNLKEGSEFFKSVISHSYTDLIGKEEVAFLNLMFNQRHLLEHRQGIVDEHYISKTGDNTYKPNQRLIVKSSHALEMIKHIRKLAEGLQRVCGG